MIRRVVSLVVLPGSIAVAACGDAGTGGDDANANAHEDACGASGYQSLVGAQLASVTLPADLGARVVGPDDVVTTDFSAERLNIEVDADGRITRVYCG